MITDSYQTIQAPAEAELKEKGSRFIARAYPLTDRDHADAIIAEISKQHYDATHNCYAWRLGVETESLSRFNDDGEPSGTAGKPILQVIEGMDLTRVLIVVTRYFGGTKLGTGGLVRAYSGAAALALENAKIIKRYISATLQLQYEYPLSNLVNTMIQKYNAQTSHTEYQQNVVQTIAIRKSLAAEFKERIIDQSAGNVMVLE